MASKYSFLLPLSLLLHCCLHLQMASSGTIAPSAGASRNLFAADIFKVLTNKRTSENVIYSPASIQTCLALAYLGAEGKTAEEMQKGLRLYDGDKGAITHSYADFLKTNFREQTAGAQLKMANAIFVNENIEVATKFAELAEHFQSRVKSLKFSNGGESVKEINNWVEQATNSKIKNLLQEGSIDGDTSSVLVNAIYFKALWEIPFSTSSTSKIEFTTSAKQHQEVDMMMNDDSFRYAELSGFDAKALELPYKDTNLSMLILLPNKVDDLAQLEQKLQGVDLNSIADKLSTQEVDVFLPRFKIEFEVDLKEPIRELGMPTMFGDHADFSTMLKTATRQKVDEIRHKAFLEVNEAGSEAAAATFMKIVPMSLNLNQKTFRADHPFVFAIRNTHAVFFAGHVTQP